MEKIEIKDFLGIKDIAIEVKQINIFIGYQASGKSASAKLLYYFKSFVSEIIDAAKQLKTEEDINENYKQKFIEYFPSSAWGEDNFYIKYSFDNEFIQVKRNDLDIKLNYSSLYRNSFDNFQSYIRALIDPKTEDKIVIWSSFSSSFLSISIQEASKKFLHLIIENIDRKISFSQRYIPAEISFFANVEKNIFFLLSTNNTIEPGASHFR